MRVAAIAGLVTAVLGAFAAGADADGRLIRVHPPSWPIGGPALTADGGVAWANPVGRDFDVTVSSPGAGRSVQRVRGLAHGETRSLRLAASATRVVFGLSVIHCTGGNCFDDPVLDGRVLAGSLGQRLRREPACGPRIPDLDVSGDVIAYINKCAGGATVRDLSAPSTAPVVSFPADHRVRIAGRYVAVDADTPGARYPAPLSGKIRVYDRLTGQLVYSVDAPNEYSPLFDIRDDGTVVFTRATGVGLDFHHEVSRASPSDPTPRTVALNEIPVSPIGLRIAGDRVAMIDAESLRVLDLYSGYVVARTDAELDDSGFDFDGERLAWSVRPCDATAIVVWDLRGRAPSLPDGPCPNATPTRVVQRGRQVQATLRCHDPARLGCSGSLDVELPDRVKRSHDFSIAPGKEKTIGLKRLSRSVACALAARRRPHATATAWAYGNLREAAEPSVHRRLRIELLARPGGCRSQRF